jgi:restriction system protein
VGNKKAEFTKYLGPVLDALRELGGSGRPKEVMDTVAKNLKISDKTREEILKNGSSKWDNQVAWARQYLVYAGLIDNSKRGVWLLTQLGQNMTLDEKQGHEVFIKYVALYQKAKKEKTNKQTIESIENDTVNDIEKEETLLDILKSVSPIGFEYLCQRLLREIGFENVEITQRSHDGGIDGYGKFKLNSLISLNVVFQCKRYKDTVSREKVAAFIGSLESNVDKGIIITTGTFSNDAKKHATEKGCHQVELIDGIRLVELFEELELGVKPIIKYSIDYKFFEEYYDIK